MPKNAYHKTPTIISNTLYTEDEYTGLLVGSAAWFRWLEEFRLTFHVTEPGFTVRCEQRRRVVFWYGYKRIGGKLHKAYIGRTPDVNPKRLADVAWRFKNMST